MHKLLPLFLSLFLLSIHTASAQSRLDRFALFLEEPPLAKTLTLKKDGRRLASDDHRRRIEASQQILRQALAERDIRVIGSTQLLTNAVFVFAPGARMKDLRALPGVARVQRMRPLRRHMNAALDVVNARNAWPIVGGAGSAGAGRRIAIIDTGIDNTHPSFQDVSLRAPEGFPRCFPDDEGCPYSNNKIIVSRSYVDLLVYTPDAPSGPEFSRPDDLSPRDRVGHGTALAMIAAGAETRYGSTTLSGVAPKAFLGNYKVFGSPGVNDQTFEDVLLLALDEAVADEMDVAVIAVGVPASWGPNDFGDLCGLDDDEPCDLWVDVVEVAAATGLTIVISAGNDGDLGLRFPSLNSIHSPGTAPSAITVGAISNSHIFFASLQTTGAGVPDSIRRMEAWFGNGPLLSAPLTAPLRDVAAGAPIGLACEPLAAGSLNGGIALIDAGQRECAFATKVNNAQRAGAVAAVIMLSDPNSDFLFPLTGLTTTGIPTAVISGRDGAALRSFLRLNPGREGVLDPDISEVPDQANVVAEFSSRGPGIGDGHIKPDLVAVGTGLLVATQSYDPNGNMWDPQQYTAGGIQGTSFAAALVGGAVALVKQAFPNYEAAQLKSAVVNTADSAVDDFTEQGTRVRASVTSVGAGKLNVAQAVRASVTAEPASLSFGVLESTGGVLPAETLTIRNAGTSPANLTLQLDPADARIRLASTSITVAASASQDVQVSITQLPPAGSYEGAVVVSGGAAPLRIPYLYLRGDGVAYNMAALDGFDFVGIASEVLGDCEFAEGTLLLAKVTDRFGVPVANLPVQFSPAGQIVPGATEATDRLGIACAGVTLGANQGEELFTVQTRQGPTLTMGFPGRTRFAPSIVANGVVNAGSHQVGQGLAAGSYAEIFGQNLSDATRVFTTSYLPLSLSNVSVSFDVPDEQVSVPGRIMVVSAGQINVQIPWELEGFESAFVKVSIGGLETEPYELPLKSHSPAFFLNSARGDIAARDEANAVIGASNPVQRGRVAQLYANGLGSVDNQPPSGDPTPAQLIRTVDTPTVTVGGVNATVLFSGLAPGAVALNQVNITVPESLQPGTHEVILTIGGVSSPPAVLAVR
jgi:uncharacterized protein (TIGR03437 family)